MQFDVDDFLKKDYRQHRDLPWSPVDLEPVRMDSAKRVDNILRSIPVSIRCSHLGGNQELKD